MVLESSKTVIENTLLQAYSSALLFSPVHSLTQELSQNEEPDWITTRLTMEADWSACIQTLYGHSNSVLSVAFLHDGTEVVSGPDSKDLGCCQRRLPQDAQRWPDNL